MLAAVAVEQHQSAASRAISRAVDLDRARAARRTASRVALGHVERRPSCRAFSRTSQRLIGVNVLRRALVAGEVAGDDAHACRRRPAARPRDVGFEQRLVAGLCRLVLGRQVDPELHHLEACRPSRVKLGEWNSSCTMPDGRRHPLHVAGADPAACAGRVAVLDLALVDDRHGLEAAVRMLADAAAGLGRRELVGPA